MDYADSALCVFFFADFLRSMKQAPNRWRYFYTWGWLDLAASVPSVGVLRLGRAVRVVRVLRILRVLRAGRMLTTALLQRREGALWTALLAATLTVFTASIAILELERETGNIKTAEDALWWAVTTITTVGYGDRYPVTTEGRLVAVCLMVIGIGLFGTLSGLAASWFTVRDKDKD
jgi:voltage-gated potassium channel